MRALRRRRTLGDRLQLLAKVKPDFVRAVDIMAEHHIQKWHRQQRRRRRERRQQGSVQ